MALIGYANINSQWRTFLSLSYRHTHFVIGILLCYQATIITGAKFKCYIQYEKHLQKRKSDGIVIIPYKSYFGWRMAGRLSDMK